jgi:hypothetical protein|tara:strand:+ start:128 stop:466 length:339 start_codon:yes stop_codon:yes gene_type:complete
MYEDPQSFAESIYKLLVDFMSSGSVASLEDYWLVNINAIKTMRKIDESLYLKLIEKFKEKKNEINANDNGSGEILNNRGSKQSRQDAEQKELDARKQKTKEYREYYSTAGLR